MALTVEEIREYLKDKPELNILLEGQEQSSAALIILSIKLTISDFNSEEPVTQFSTANFPNDVILLYGVCHHLANGEAERQLRNNVDYNAQGMNVGIENKFEVYNRLADYYKKLFDAKASRYKRFLNTEAAWGESWSPYAVLPEYDFR